MSRRGIHRTRYRPDVDTAANPGNNADMKGLVRAKGGKFATAKNTRTTADKNKIAIAEMKAAKKIADTEIHTLKSKLHVRVQTDMRKMAESEVEELVGTVEAEEEEKKTLKKRIKELEKEVLELN
jgi:hypothetical protein